MSFEINAEKELKNAFSISNKTGNPNELLLNGGIHSPHHIFAKPAKVEIGKNGAKVPYKTLKTTEDGIEVRKGCFASDACAYPGDSSKFYLITDRGPGKSSGRPFVCNQ